MCRYALMQKRKQKRQVWRELLRIGERGEWGEWGASRSAGRSQGVPFFGKHRIRCDQTGGEQQQLAVATGERVGNYLYRCRQPVAARSMAY